jgi:hypothetical protein
MKIGKHYAQALAWPGQPSNGILPDQHGKEGVDSFIQEDRYFPAYARYFHRYVEEYAKAGVPISMVMPQNEFNSAQPFPSCCWTPANALTSRSAICAFSYAYGSITETAILGARCGARTKNAL